MKEKILYVAFFSFLLASCSAPKDITYFQTGNSITKEQVSLMKNYIDPIIKEGDVLALTVSATNPESVVPFNLPMVSFAQNGVVSNSSGTRDIGVSQAMQTYTVNADGFINFPVIGKIKIAGMRKRDVVDLLEERISTYVQDPIVNLNISNFKVTVLGEVNRPGSFSVTSDRISLLDVLGNAGDLTIYGNRKNIKVIRDTKGIKEILLFDLTKNDLLTDPNFYLQQNDVVYVEPNPKRQKNSKYSQTEQYKLSVVTAIATICSVALTVIISLNK